MPKSSDKVDEDELLQKICDSAKEIDFSGFIADFDKSQKDDSYFFLEHYHAFVNMQKFIKLRSQAEENILFRPIFLRHIERCTSLLAIVAWQNPMSVESNCFRNPNYEQGPKSFLISVAEMCYNLIVKDAELVKQVTNGKITKKCDADMLHLAAQICGLHNLKRPGDKQQTNGLKLILFSVKTFNAFHKEVQFTPFEESMHVLLNGYFDSLYDNVTHRFNLSDNDELYLQQLKAFDVFLQLSDRKLKLDDVNLIDTILIMQRLLIRAMANKKFQPSFLENNWYIISNVSSNIRQFQLSLVDQKLFLAYGCKF